MALDSASKVGQYLGKLSTDQVEIQSNLSPDDTDPVDNLFNSEEVILEGTVTGRAWYYASDSFIIDHVVLGDIDSSTLNIDGGYASDAITIPVTVPIEFEQDTLLFTKTL